jgi:hypothetical protein
MRWKINEFKAWLRAHITYPGPDGRPVKFVPNDAQGLLMVQPELSGEPGWLTIAKARQLGVSTLLLLLVLWLCITRPGIQILVVTPNEEPTGDEIITKWRALMAAAERAPDSGWPGKPRHDSKSETVFANGSRVAWHHIGGTKTVADAVGRAGTYALAILTELAFPFDAPLAWRTIDALMPALERAKAPVIVDSTPGESPGAGDCYRALLAAAVNDGIGRHVLLPWWTFEGYRITPAPPLSRISREERRLMIDHGLDAGQIAWRRQKLKPRAGETPQAARARFEKAYLESVDAALRQTSESDIWPADFVEAINARVFDPPYMLDDHLKRLHVFDLAHDARWGEPAPRGYVRAWQLPDPDRRYFAGIDAADGLPGGDWLTLTILDDASRYALTARLKVETLHAAAIFQRLVELYNAPTRVERNKGALLARYMREPVDARVAVGRELAPLRHAIRVPLCTFNVSPITRPEVLGAALGLLGDPSVAPDRETRAELLGLVRNKGKLEHGSSSHDDLIFSAGHAALERRARLTSTRPANPRGRKLPTPGRKYDYLIDDTGPSGYPSRRGRARGHHAVRVQNRRDRSGGASSRGASHGPQRPRPRRYRPE